MNNLVKLRQWINTLKIKSKLVILFVIIKAIPVLIITIIAFRGAILLESKLIPQTEQSYKENQETFQKVSSQSITESIMALDSQYQKNIEQQGTQIGKQIANFLYQRDQDLLLLASMPISYETFQQFAKIKTAPVIIPGDYYYDEISGTWIPKNPVKFRIDTTKARLEQNNNFFSHKASCNRKYQKIPIYQEITYFDLTGNELIKYSNLNPKLLNIKHKKNTYVNSENYYNEIHKLKKGEIYVSQMVGAYVGSRVRGIYNKKNAETAEGQFRPESSAFAGIENPLGKRFKGIIRFITPYYQNNKKIGYISLAMNHRHIQEFTDYVSPIPTEERDLPDSNSPNYCYLWSADGLAIAHPKNYYIMGYKPSTGKMAAPWLHQELYQKWKESGLSDAYTFLQSIPEWNHPEEFKTPSIEQALDSGYMGLDIRYSREPMWTGYGLFQLTEDSGSGSYQYFWDGKWKLMTASPIPYYSGRYKSSPRGFGIVCLGADVNEFHKAAEITQKKLQAIIEKANVIMHSNLKESQSYLHTFSRNITRKLTLVSLLMITIIILIAIWLSNYLTSKLNKLLIGTQEFGKKNFSYRIPLSSKDEIGILEEAFNQMAIRLEEIISQYEEAKKELTLNNIELKTITSFLNCIQDYSPDAILVHMPTGKIHSVNQTCEQLFEYTRDEIIGLTVADISGPLHSQDKAVEKIQQAWENGGIDFEWISKNKSGKQFPSSVRLRRIKVNNEEFILSFVTDITKREKVKKELIRTNRQLSDIIEFLPDATFVIDKNKKVIAWNRALEEMTQINKSEIIGKGDYEYSIPFYGERRPILIDLITNDDPEIRKKYNNITQQGNYLMGEVYVPSFYGGKGATVRVTASPLIGENGNIYGAIESVRDISHLKKAEDALKQSEEKYRTIFDHGVLGIFQSTLQGRFISINMAFAKMLGFNSPEETINSIHNISEQFYLDQSRRKLILEELINSNEIKTYAEKFKSRSGKIWVGNLNVRLVRDSQNNPKYLEGFIEDITENKEYEQKLIEAKEKAEESERLKSAFLANMSHEIRTPLNGILGFASLLEQDDLETSKRSKFIHIINTNSRQLLQIINDILDFSKIEVGQLIIVESDVLLEDLIRELHALFSEQIENDGKLQLNFQLEGEAELSNLKVLTDGGRLKQILYNLLSNAIKFTNKGNITLGFQKPDDSNILFYVKDTGIGIPKEMHQQIFDRFRQVDDAHTRQFGGTGLGLAISKELIKLMKGEIWLESELGKGTVFYIKIPYKPIIES